MKSINYKYIIGGISFLVPLIVAYLLFGLEKEEDQDSFWIAFLPHLNAIINIATSLILLGGFYFIKKGKQEWHRTAMMTAFVLGFLFLVSYIIYHSLAPSTVYGDIDKDGVLNEIESGSIGKQRIVYLVFLLSHIILAAIVVPFVLTALYFALAGKFDRHRKIVKFAFPIWLYVSISGVIVYLMISPYY